MTRHNDDQRSPRLTSNGSDQKTVRHQPITSSTEEGTDSTFLPDEMLVDRFKIVRFIAQGGMGKVYEAEDLILHEHVALKTIRPEIAADETAVLRFKREIRLARKITHPNVCRIYDIFQHEPSWPDGQAHRARKITFLSMELLRGETLQDRIRRSGPMPSAEALPLIHQLASALEAAHRAGIIHRDFKSANVVLVPPEHETELTRAVVTDFG
jgi:serine/threonine protein kinase